MGDKWEVALWDKWDDYRDGYSYRTFYMGPSLVAALWTFWRERHACGCITLHYRGGRIQ